jgi:ribosomal protein S18 acetylase RimI-like enzyme
MGPAAEISIELLDISGFGVFLDYLNDHLSDNGTGNTAYFQPLPRAESYLPAEKAEAIRNGLRVPVDEPGWRRVWVARAPSRQIAGHIDLRSHPERLAAHRCVLGMGVDRDYRKLGLGSSLLAHAEKWAVELTTLEWIDLQVLSANEPAISLYRRAGYKTIGEVPEMFKIDGQAFSYTSMAKRIAGSS